MTMRSDSLVTKRSPRAIHPPVPPSRLTLMFFVIGFFAISLLSTPASAQNRKWQLDADSIRFVDGVLQPLLNQPLANPAASIHKHGGKARELLLVEKRPVSKKTPQLRQVNAYVYDYETNETIHLVIDLSSRRVVETHRLAGVQLPLNENEEKRLEQIALADPENRKTISDSFVQSTGRTLNSLGDLVYKAFIFRADSESDDAAYLSEACGQHRCAKMLIYTSDDIVLDVSPIIDLSIGEVIQIYARRDDDPVHSHSH